MSSLPWDQEAREAMKRVPALVRPLARRKVEERVRAAGGERVTLAAVQEAEARFQAVRGGRSDTELASILPQANRPGVAMVVLEACRHQVAGCPNALLDLTPWQAAVEAWIADSDLNERLRARVGQDQVLFHHKLRIALAGCPNGCSRPQIADLALVGSVRPQLVPEDCMACGECAVACPDGAISIEDLAVFDRGRCQGCLACSQACETGAITLGPAQGRILMGGKLGRHPHLAETVGEVADPAGLVARLEAAVNRYLDEARPGERFAAWWVREGSGGGPDLSRPGPGPCACTG